MSWFSGIGGFDLALVETGHQVVGACEIDPHCREVYLARFGKTVLEHPFWFPEDIEKVRARDVPKADLWVAGSPCQGFSIAGGRDGLEDPRSGLLRTFVALVAKARPRWLVLENVPRPGILDANDGRDFGEFSLPWMTAGIGGRGACLTRSISECPNDAVVSSLSDILEPETPARFFLSPRAAKGILKRASRRGRALPPVLAEALEAVASRTPNQEDSCPDR